MGSILSGSSTGTLEVIGNMLFAVVIGLFIYWVYKRTYTGVMYSMNFNLTIMLTSLVTAMVMMVIRGNLALSLGLVGALSIIRFRSAIKDPRDIGFLFWGIAGGLCAGTGTDSYATAIVGSLVIAMMLFIFKKKGYEAYPYLLVVRGGVLDATKLRQIVMFHTENHNLRMRNTSSAGTEIIYEIKFKEGQEELKEDQLVTEIRKMENINVVNVVYYKGEIPG